MILVDINVLLYAVDAGSSHHAVVKPWLTKLLNQPDGVALCWPVISGFIRIATNAKVLQNPMTTEEACDKIDEWIALPGTRLIYSSSHHWRLFSDLLKQTNATGNLVSDAHLAAIAIEHGLELASCDTDFAKFPDLHWINPLTS